MRAKRIERVQYSALLDDETCDVCRALAGQQWPLEDPRTRKYENGNPDCHNGAACRCVLIYIGRNKFSTLKS